MVVRGTAEETRGEDVFPLQPNESTYIPVGTVHRLHNSGEEDHHIIEVQCGDYLGEDDVSAAAEILGEVIGRELWRDPKYQTANAVT